MTRCIVASCIGLLFVAYSEEARAATSIITLSEEACLEDPDAAPWALYRVDLATGDRTFFSGRMQDCSVVGSGTDFLGDNGAYVTIDADGSIFFVGDNAAGQSVFLVDPTTGDRTIVSGCLDRFCTSSIGSGPMPTSTNGAAVEPTIPPSLSALFAWALPLLVGLLAGLGVRSVRAGSPSPGE